MSERQESVVSGSPLNPNKPASLREALEKLRDEWLEFIKMLETERGHQVHTLLELKRTEDAGEICAMEDTTQSVMCLYEPLHAGRHSWQPETSEVPDDDPTLNQL